MKVKDVIEHKGRRVFTVGADASLAEAARLLTEHRIGALLVMKSDQIAGILSERDIVHHLAHQGGTDEGATVGDVMTRDVLTCSSSDDVEDVMGSITRHRMRHVPVVDDGELCGLISIGDLVKHRLMEIETEKNVLRDILVAR